MRKLPLVKAWFERNMWWLRWVFLALIGAALLVANLLITTRKGASKTEEGLATFIMFVIGLGVSYYFGQKSMADAASAMVKPQARGAARRLRTLGRLLQAQQLLLERHRRQAHAAAVTTTDMVPLGEVEFAVDALLIHTDATLRTVVDAVEDWREFDAEILNDLPDDTDGPAAMVTGDGQDGAAGWEFDRTTHADRAEGPAE